MKAKCTWRHMTEMERDDDDDDEDESTLYIVSLISHFPISHFLFSFPINIQQVDTSPPKHHPSQD